METSEVVIIAGIAALVAALVYGVAQAFVPKVHEKMNDVVDGKSK